MGACPWCTPLDPPLLLPKVEYKQKYSVADPRGSSPGTHPTTAQNCLDFTQFLGKFDKIVCWRPPGTGPWSLVLIIVQCISVEKLKGKYTRKFQKSVPMCRFIKTPRTYTWFHFKTPKWCLMSSTVNILHFWMITNEYVLFRRFLIRQNTSCSS